MEEPLCSLLLVLILFVSGDAVNPGCDCLQYSETYGKEYGTFNSPDYPRPYPANINCLLYTFIADIEEIVEITFKDFDVYKTHLDCIGGDFLKIFLHLEKPEVDEYTNWSGLLCGGYSDVPAVLYSSGPVLILEFHTTDASSNATGFIGTFRFIDRRTFRTDGQKLPGTICDYQFISSNHTLNHGRFYSPRYPSNYPQNIKCAYRFRARATERIRIVFEEVTLQKGDVSCLNRADVIKVHDGRSAVSPTIRVVCNEASALEVLSTGPDLFIEFLADSEWPGQGFKAAFQFQPLLLETTPQTEAETSADVVVEKPGPPAVQKQTADLIPSVSATTANCDVVVTSDGVKNGSVASPGYPGPYPARTSCRYDFQGRGKERVQVFFTDFSLYHPTDDSKECESIDSLMAYVLIDGRMEKIDNFCGSTLPRPLMSNGPRLMLEFRGIYSSRQSRGFRAVYSFTENFGVQSGQQAPDLPCAFVFNSTEANEGIFHSPNFPGFYPRDTECHYFFNGQTGQRVKLNFNYFDVEGVLPCEAISASDYVEFSNFMARDRKYSRHCGQLQEFSVESDRKFFRVTFRSNDRLDGTGFNASYQFLDQEDIPTSVRPTERTGHSSTLTIGPISHPTLILIILLVISVFK
ncbi:suppressor of lurcher protein 1-like isoform X2 [Lycorma delicatula]|uniref:suppressor of lurcher protein 1-like isoform X2 n=1 Tax=Lycorma delicatula TaxID=130591 RepID=UPI003F5108FD